MKIMGLGLDFDGEALFPAVEGEQFTEMLAASMEANAEALETITRTTSRGTTYRGEVEREALDPGDPRRAGWTFLLNKHDARWDDLVQALAPLAARRGMANPQQPLVYNDEGPDEWFDWLQDNYYALKLEGKTPPHYILIVGGPEQVPFRFQAVLSTVANVGRLDFDSLAELQQYVDKVIRLEKASAPAVKRAAVLFAPDAGAPDPTYYSREYMAKPLTEHIRDAIGMPAQACLGKEATKANLLQALQEQQPALVYTASHGLGALKYSPEFQRKYNGAICCQHSGKMTMEALFSADDVPMTAPFLEGAVFFQFACFGYGTPAESDYAHWLQGTPKQYGPADFTAALPKRLLAHPRGPIAYVGHLDTAFLHGFAEAEAPDILERWHNRVTPFVAAVDELLGVRPCGFAMRELASRYNVCNMVIANTYDRQKRGKLIWKPELRKKFLDTWITRSDAQNYMVLGDPAAHLRIPTA
jgi:hypothetical protein